MLEAFFPAHLRPRTRIHRHFACLLRLKWMVILSELCWNAWQTRSTNATMPMHHRTNTSDSATGASHPIPHPRVIWLILDELSYRQVYEHRFPGLELPAFDRLATQSTIFTQVAPAGIRTEYVVPSLMSGIPADAIRVSADGRQLSLRNPIQDLWENFDPHQTVFQDALNHGFSTAVSGWFNPYCRLLPQVLDHCFWTYRDPLRDGIWTGPTFTGQSPRAISQPLGICLTFHLRHRHEGDYSKIAAQQHIQDYRDLFTASRTMLNDSSADFLFLHMPIPHPFGIYNRHTGQFTTGPSTYIDNLALADAYLADLRSQLEQRGEWDSSTILIMGDHSWRTAPIWVRDTHLDREEQKASDGGQFDDRPAYILKLPQPAAARAHRRTLPSSPTRALLDALMDQRIQSPQDLAAWVANPSIAQSRNSTADHSASR